MESRNRSARILGPLAFAGLMLSPFRATGEDVSATHVTIRGTGSDVRIERGAKPVTRGFGPAGTPSGPIAEAIRLKSGGADDTAVVAYLRAHAGDLPRIVDAESARRLRRAGAGTTVFGYLATAAAIDIGATGEGASAETASTSAAEAPQPGEPSYGFGDPSAGYPFYGGGIGYPVGGGFPLHRRGAGRVPFLRREFPRTRMTPIVPRLPGSPLPHRKVFP
jgi:hypothetical protein